MVMVLMMIRNFTINEKKKKSILKIRIKRVKTRCFHVLIT